MNEPLKVGVAGLGAVGGGVVDLLTRNAELIAARAGRKVEIAAVSAANPNKNRDFDISGFAFETDAIALAARSDVDVVVEAIGGESGVALDLCRAAIMSGKDVVTANKAMLAHHGFELAQAAENQAVGLAFEAAVAGGVPIVKALREGLAANAVISVRGILNGTCNYILSHMTESGRPFAEILDEAQQLGYAEAEPSLDVDGIDAAHKLALLAAIAFGVKPRFDAIPIEGVRAISPDDLAFASELGYAVKLIGSAGFAGGKLEQRMHPAFVEKGEPLAGVAGVFNAIEVVGGDVDTVFFEGRGAGRAPTASAIVADLIDLGRGLRPPAFGVSSGALRDAEIAAPGDHEGAYYLRLEVTDRPGVLASVAGVLSEHSISVESLIQRGRDPEGAVSIVMTTHRASEKAVLAAIDQLAALESVASRPKMIRIEG